ncbi:MAG: hypothetical protein HQL16_04015 [Candidatus Omnitrophica bacterium]|nr:hypothetical protein [Candidatus Omnitrophota bacterium]
MLKQTTSLTLTAIILLSATIAQAETVSKSFKVSVTIPPSVTLVNNFVNNAPDAVALQKRLPLSVQEQIEIRGSKTVVVKSIVVL